MNHIRSVAAACACVVAMTGAVDAAREKKRTPSRPTPQAQKAPSDPFKACDVQVREYLREGGTWLTPKEVKADEARLLVTVTHAFGDSGKSLPRYLRGDSEEEKRQSLRGYLGEMREAVEAAKTGRAWYII